MISNLTIGALCAKHTSTDPLFSSVIGLWHFDSLSGTFPDSSSKGNHLTPIQTGAGATPTLDTSTLKFGAGSMHVTTLGAASVLSNDFILGTGDFCIESWFRPTSSAGYQCLWNATAATGTIALRLYVSFNGDGNISIYTNVVNAAGAQRITGGAVSLNTWHHSILSRVSGVSYLGMDGAQQGSNYTDTNNYGGTSITFTVGNIDFAQNALTQFVPGNGDETRVTKGNGRGYTGGSYTVPTAPYPNS